MNLLEFVGAVVLILVILASIKDVVVIQDAEDWDAG